MKPAEEYILKQKEPLQSILLHLQILIEVNFPEVALLYKWKLPFYYLNNKPFCYLNATKKAMLMLVFTLKHLLKNIMNSWFQKKGRQLNLFGIIL